MGQGNRPCMLIKGNEARQVKYTADSPRATLIESALIKLEGRTHEPRRCRRPRTPRDRRKKPALGDLRSDSGQEQKVKRRWTKGDKGLRNSGFWGLKQKVKQGGDRLM